MTKLNGTLTKACEPLSEGIDPGVIKTNLLKGVLLEHEKTLIVQFEPTSGTTLANMELGEACSLGESVAVVGKMTLKDSAISTEAVEHLASEGPLTSMRPWVNP